MMLAELTVPQIGRYRLMSQRLAEHPCQTPAEVVTWMGAMQAQDYHQAVWAIGSRMNAATLVDVERAIEDGDILRTYPMRGTIHFVPAEDAKWMLKLAAYRNKIASPSRLKQLELTETILNHCQSLIQKALSGGNRFTRPELLETLENTGISTKGQRGYHILGYSVQNGVTCIGPMQDKQPTYVLLDEWVPNSRDLSEDDALAEFTWRFFRSHAPATIDDFARWGGLTQTLAKSGIQMQHEQLTSIEIDGGEYWMPNDMPLLPSNHDPEIHLLAGFDEFVIGYKDRSAVVPDEHANKIVPGNNGVFFPIIVVDGQVVGTWKRKLKSNSMDITLTPFTSFGDLEAAIIAKAQSYSDFLNLPIATCDITV